MAAGKYGVRLPMDQQEDGILFTIKGRPAPGWFH